MFDIKSSKLRTLPEGFKDIYKYCMDYCNANTDVDIQEDYFNNPLVAFDSKGNASTEIFTELLKYLKHDMNNPLILFKLFEYYIGNAKPNDALNMIDRIIETCDSNYKFEFNVYKRLLLENWDKVINFKKTSNSVDTLSILLDLPKKCFNML